MDFGNQLIRGPPCRNDHWNDSNWDERAERWILWFAWDLAHKNFGVLPTYAFANPLTGSFWWNKKCVLHIFVTNRCWPCEAHLWRPSSALGSSNRVAKSMRVGLFNFHTLYCLVGGLEHVLCFHILGILIPYNPNWRTPSFFRGVGIPPTSFFFNNLI
jgi:hypothetical protein